MPVDTSSLPPEGVRRVMEAILFLAKRPVAREEFYRFFPTLSQEDGDSLLLEIRKGYEKGSALLLEEVAGGFRFTTRQELFPYLQGFFGLKKELRFSKAALETLAIIAYRQPVTRGDIEEIRGVAVNANVIKTLEERGWIDVVGHRETPGRPALFATTKQFLDDLGLRAVSELPPLEQISQTLELNNEI